MSRREKAEALLLGTMLANGGDEPDWWRYDVCLVENKEHPWGATHDKEVQPLDADGPVTKQVVTCRDCGVWKVFG